MRKEAYQILKKRLQQLIIDEQENICFITAGQLQEMIESGITPNYAIKHIGLWNRQVEFIESESPFLCRQHLLSLEKYNGEAREKEYRMQNLQSACMFLQMPFLKDMAGNCFTLIYLIK